MAKIKVVGAQATLELDDVKDTVIQLGGKYYFKHDQKNLVRIKTPTGKYRLYRKESPLITETQNGTFVRISDAIKTEAGLFYDKTHEDTIRLEDGSYTHKKWTYLIDGKRYSKTDARVIRLPEDGGFDLRSNCVSLSPTFYGKDYLVRYNPDHYAEIDGEFWKLSDVREVIYWDAATASPIVAMFTRDKLPFGDLTNNVFHEYKDVSNPQVGRYSTCYGSRAACIKDPDTNLYVLKEMYDKFVLDMSKILHDAGIKNTLAVKAILNPNFGDLDDTENTAKVISKDYQIWPGKSVLFGGNNLAVLSKSVRATGGLGYSFGVEIETSAGVVPSDLARKHNYTAVGDRSIGAAEYVTPVLHGDKGIQHLRNLCEDLATHTLVDDRCSVHVHIGSAPHEGLNAWPIAFDRSFAIAAIKLGCNIEEELYKMLPPARSPFNRHCHSIRRYERISAENYREYLGTFVFGPQENWKSTVDFRNYKYGVGSISKDHTLPTWCGGRYKWLNLVRSYSNCGSPTVEIRIWSPSTNFNKVYCYTLLSLAFAHVAATHSREVMNEKMTLERMVTLAFPTRTDLVELLMNFIEARKEKFHRTNVYKSFPINKMIETKNITTETENAKLTLTQPV